MARKPQRPRQRSQGRKNSGAAAARRKDAIDRSLAASKVPAFDPAAAPLGTDAETAGAPPVAADKPPVPEPEEASVDPANLAADPSGTERRRYRLQDRLVWPVIAGLLIAAAIVAAVLFAWS